MFQGSQKPARHLPDLVPSSCALAPRQTREAGFLVKNIDQNNKQISVVLIKGMYFSVDLGSEITYKLTKSEYHRPITGDFIVFVYFTVKTFGA